MPWRGISNLLALLIAVGIVIGVTIVVSGIVSDILVKQKPKGADLVLTGFMWWWEYVEDKNEYVIHVKGSAVNLGTNKINITGVYVVVNGVEYAVRYHRIESLKPNHVAEIIGSVKAPLPDSTALTVVVEWCNIRECSKSIANAQLSNWVDIINKNAYEVITVTMPADSSEPATTITITQTETVTTTVPSTISTTTITRTITSTITETQTQTITTTTTVIQTKPSWPVVWTACYDIADYIYVSGSLLRPISEKESIPYVVKFYECSVFGCSLLAVKPFEWVSKSSFEAKYYLPDPKPFRSYKIEIWSINWETGRFIDKVYEQAVDTSVRCA